MPVPIQNEANFSSIFYENFLSFPIIPTNECICSINSVPMGRLKENINRINCILFEQATFPKSRESFPRPDPCQRYERRRLLTLSTLTSQLFFFLFFHPVRLNFGTTWKDFFNFSPTTRRLSVYTVRTFLDMKENVNTSCIFEYRFFQFYLYAYPKGCD